MKTGSVNKSFIKIMEKLNNPPIALVWGHNIGNSHGRAWNDKKSGKVIQVRYKNRTIQFVRNTIWHEIAHHLFPNKPHWWIECFAWKMCPRYKRKEVYFKWEVGRYTQRYQHSPYDLPSKKKLLKMAIKASQRLLHKESSDG